MAWCFSTRASVATVLTMHPCVSRCLRVKIYFAHIPQVNFIGINLKGNHVCMTHGYCQTAAIISMMINIPIGDAILILCLKSFVTTASYVSAHAILLTYILFCQLTCHINNKEIIYLSGALTQNSRGELDQYHSHWCHHQLSFYKNGSLCEMRNRFHSLCNISFEKWLKM